MTEIEVLKILLENLWKIVFAFSFFILVWHIVKGAYAYIIYGKLKIMKNNITMENAKVKNRCIQVILIIFIVVALTLALFDSNDALDYFSFASTLTSIILSVLAIMLTITSEMKNESIKYELSHMIEEMQIINTSLKASKKSIEDAQIKLNNQLPPILKKLDDIFVETQNLSLKLDKKDDKDFMGKNVKIETNMYVAQEDSGVKEK